MKLLIFQISLLVCMQASATELFIATDADRKSKTPGKGLYVCDVDDETGALGEPRVLMPDPAATQVTRVANGKLLYTSGVGELLAVHRDTGEIVSKKAVENLSSCYLALSPKRDLLFSADIHTGRTTLVSLKENGEIGEVLSQVKLEPAEGYKRSRPHCVEPSPDGRFLFMADISGKRVVRFSR